MNDLRIDEFLESVRKDLREFFNGREADERVREMRGHLEEAVLEHGEAGSIDPVGEALQAFGERDAYRKGAQTAGGGALSRRSEREVLRLIAWTLLLPLAADLLMDLSSWSTGSDSSLYGIGIPVVSLLALRMAFVSIRSRRFLLVPILTLTTASFALFLFAGGFVRAADPEMSGLYGTRTRGTAYRRMNSLKANVLPEKQARLDIMNRAAQLFASNAPTKGIGEFRTATGYLVPVLSDESRASWKGDPRAPRWLLDELDYRAVATYQEAHDTWLKRSPEFLRLAKLGVDGEVTEIKELERVVACPWLVSIKAETGEKAAMALFSAGWLLFLHGLGVASGALIRSRRRGTTT